MPSSNFQAFALAVHKRYNELAKRELFVLQIDKDTIWQMYLNAFPAGTNPIFRTNTEHDCSCCRQFIKNLGRLVAIDDNHDIQSVWDNWQDLPEPYATVSRVLSEFVRFHGIATVFRTKEPMFGTESNIERLDNGGTYRWHHFHGKAHDKHHSREPDTERGRIDAAKQVFERGLREITPLAFETVLDLIDSNALYRGAEHRNAVAALHNHQRAYEQLEGHRRNNYAWGNCTTPYAQTRNTAIGTLLVDLSSDMPVEDAVKAFEAKVAPTNYRRPTAIVTQSMVKQAMKTIEDLGLEPALQRRHAALADVSINDVLWASNSSKRQMRGNIETLLLNEIKTQPMESKGVDISIHDFMTHVIPKAQEIELYVKTEHRKNFLSLTAPIHADAPKLFKWNNGFSWSYAGDVTDAIKERVKAAGGDIDAKLRFSLAWYNHDDLDLHVHTPSGAHVYFGQRSGGGGTLDVDMNAFGPRSRTPVENTVFPKPQDGTYRVFVHQYSRRESVDVGFEMQLVFNSQVTHVRYPKMVAGGVAVAEMKISGDKANIKLIDLDLESSLRSVDHWGVKTETFVPVSTLMLSPNHWGGNEVGNKHWIFMLEGCKNPESVRSIYNEYLSAAAAHGKVFELLGARTKAPYADEQLSGVGFSSTRADKVTVRVKTSSTQRTYNVIF